MTINNKPLWSDIQEELSKTLGQAIHIELGNPVSGGDISEAFVLQARASSTQTADKFFVKVNRREFLGVFEAEARALNTIASHVPNACPSPILMGTHAERSYFVMQYLNLSGSPKSNATANPKALGELLAKLHLVHNSESAAKTPKIYGWNEDNFIGRTPQQNSWNASWATFFVEQRLKPQFKLACSKGFHHQLSAISSEIFIAVENILKDYQPHASLLHGDLWGGNAAYDADGKPWIFDPASYYGDAETDIAMTELFGGFNKDFYEAYYAVIPQAGDYLQRKTIYNLYHMLNHLNLFGSGYLAQVQRYIKLILS